ncbi:MAG: glutamate-5-semialdehyde dehydrogenase [Bacteroidaceae bacterium]|nr:glutamate-5-semialdehyde dehydrogenase [Bacteroidaceae bacterium]
MKTIFENAKQASRELALLCDERKNTILNKVADAIAVHQAELLEANARDLAKMDPANPLYDRLQLTESRLEGIAGDMRNVAKLPSPLGHITNERTLENGLYLRRISVPFGVIGMVYEARPNVSFDVFSLCFKSGNACVLKGGKDADESNRAIVGMIHDILKEEGINPSVVELLPATHEATAEMLNAVGYIDLCIPRGGKKLIEFVRDNARVPVIETGAGVVHAYFDKDGDLEMAKRIVNNAKTRRVSVCNALDCLLVHADRQSDLEALLEPMKGKVNFHYDDYGKEWMSYDMSIKVVASLDEALAHIRQYSSGHSECIITNNEETAARFRNEVDAACVYVNAPTSFTDGAQFGLGAEIGISTQKLGPRGPMALEEMTTYKWLIDGNGQVRA